MRGLPWLLAVPYTLRFSSPLAMSIRASPQISVIKFVTSERAISLYADDVILSLLDVRTSLSPFLDLINRFGKLSGCLYLMDLTPIF